MSRGRVRTGVAAGLALLLAACSGVSPPPTTEQPPGTGQVEPPGDAGAGTRPTGITTADGAAAAPVAMGVIGPCSLGPLVVGMGPDDAQATGLASYLQSGPQGSGFVFRPAEDIFIAGTAESGIVGFLVKSPRWRTPEGIAAGTSMIADLRRAYAGAVVRGETEQGLEYFSLRDGDCGYFFAADGFGDPDGPIAVIISGLWSAVSRARPNTSFG